MDAEGSGESSGLNHNIFRIATRFIHWVKQLVYSNLQYINYDISWTLGTKKLPNVTHVIPSCVKEWVSTQMCEADADPYIAIPPAMNSGSH